MKKYLLLLLLFVILAGCEDNSIDPTIMPEESTTGEGTFGLLYDGWIYVGGRYANVDVLILNINISASIQFYYDEPEDKMYVGVQLKPDHFIRFTIENPKQEKYCKITEVYWNYETLADCKAYITRFDKESMIISGRFEGGHIEHGRFDVKYNIYE